MSILALFAGFAFGVALSCAVHRKWNLAAGAALVGGIFVGLRILL